MYFKEYFYGFSKFRVKLNEHQSWVKNEICLLNKKQNKTKRVHRFLLSIFGSTRFLAPLNPKASKTEERERERDERKLKLSHRLVRPSHQEFIPSSYAPNCGAFTDLADLLFHYTIGFACNKIWESCSVYVKKHFFLRILC